MTKSRDLANAATALNAVTATELGYVDGVTSAIQTQLDAKIPKSLPTAKGDILTATASGTPAVLAVGNSGEQIVADSSTSTGLRYTSNFAAGKNAIINGAINVWQRGTSITVPIANNSYSGADRFQFSRNGTGSVVTCSRVAFTPGTAPQSGYEGNYFMRFNQTTAGSGGSYNEIIYRIEDVTTFAGQTATFSFWAKADSSRTLSSNLTLNQNFGSGGSGTVGTTMTLNSYALTTAWARYTGTITVPSISGKTIGTSSFLEIDMQLFMNTTFTFDTWGWQLEAGSVASAFQTATGTIQGELAACQRYYFRMDGAGAADSPKSVVGFSVAIGTSRIVIPLPVTLRVKPSSLDYNNMRLDTGATTYTITAMGFNDISPTSVEVSATVTSGPAAGTAVRFIPTSGSTTSYLGFNAEL